jgi:glycogen debranching enzyme
MPETNRSLLNLESGDRDRNLWSEYEIEAKTSLADRVLRTLKDADAFAVLDTYGDIGMDPDSPEGLFYQDTRFLSHFEFRIEGKRPLLLSSGVHDDKAVLSVDLTNPDVRARGEKLSRDTLFIHRAKFLWRSICYERITIKNFGISRQLRLDFLFDADFRDMFEIRGTRRLRHGITKARVKAPNVVEFEYFGLDGVMRRTTIHFDPEPTVIGTKRATIDIDIPAHRQVALFITTSCVPDAVPPSRLDFFFAYREVRKVMRAATANIATITAPNDAFNGVICRATSDTYTLITQGQHGPYPYAGIPWFNTIFGRDGLITAMLMLWVDPAIARGVLQTLAAHQAMAIDPLSDAQPGKILHEMRKGEMANLREVPFGRYYGTIDATPLFIVLAGMYLDRTGDIDLVRDIWPNIRAALTWIDEYGDADNDGFVEYERAAKSGLANQGWKDSHDAIFHDDGSDPVGPIALCEVQGYVFAARQYASRLAWALGEGEFAARLAMDAERLRKNFEERFWCEELGSYALALDGEKRPCRVVTSNAGHALFAGIASPERARRVAASLMGADGFCGWGIRTLAAGQVRYNPMSYHNGSVWPHDNALIALGFARYGLKRETARICTGLFDAARRLDSSRLPELFCGFRRHPHRSPTPYPVACSPQAWASAAIFGLLEACLGLELAADRDEIRFRDPVLPDFLDELAIKNLSLGPSHIDILLRRHGQDVTLNVLDRQGTSKIALLK